MGQPKVVDVVPADGYDSCLPKAAAGSGFHPLKIRDPCPADKSEAVQIVMAVVATIGVSSICYRDEADRLIVQDHLCRDRCAFAASPICIASSTENGY